MESSQREIVGSGKVIAYSVAAAALIGTLASALFGGKEKKQEQAQRKLETRLAGLEEATGQTLNQLNDVVAEIREQASGRPETAGRKASNLSRSASRKADDAVKAVSGRAKELDREARQIGATEAALGLGSDASRRAQSLARTFTERSSELLADAQSAAPGWKNKAASSLADVKQSGRTLGEQARERAPEIGVAAQSIAHDAARRGELIRHDVQSQVPVAREKANQLWQDASDLGKTYVSQARGKSPEVKSQVSGLVSDLTDHAREVAPEIQERATQAASRVGDAAGRLTSQARDRAPSLLESVSQTLVSALEDAQHNARPVLEEILSQASSAGKTLSDDVAPDVRHRVQDVTSKLSGQTHAASATLAASGKGATQRIAHTTEVVEQHSKQAASAAGRGTLDFGALAGWTAAAVGIVYVTFLNDRQQERVRASGKRIAGELLNVVRDIRGQDGEFT